MSDSAKKADTAAEKELRGENHTLRIAAKLAS
jgi:hypothetical protein